MAFGSTPKYSENIPLNELTKEQFLVVALETAKKLEWEINYVSENGFIAYTNKGVFTWNANVEVKINFNHGYATVKSSSAGSEMLDWGKNKKNSETFLSKFRSLKPTFTIEELDSKYEELRKELVSNEEDILNLPPKTTKEQIMDVLSIFIPVKNYFVTPILLNLNILIFILMAIYGVNIFEPSTESLLNWGANFRPMTLEGEWWRLITNCFLHIGIFHLLMNMYALFSIGILLEPYFGKTRFIAAYLLTGITASIASLWWHDLTVSAGASGAIFGMYGVFFAMLTTNLVEISVRKKLLVSIAIFITYNLVYGLSGGIDNAAHIGGLIGGLIIGYAFIPSLKKPESQILKFSSIAAIAVLILTSSFAVYKNTSNDLAKYDEGMQNFASMEEMALELYKTPVDTPKENILTLIKDKGIYYWKENIKLLDELDKLNLPEELHDKNTVLKQYCELRIKSYELIYKTVAEDTQKYNEEMRGYDDQIRAIMTNLSVAQEELNKMNNQ